MGVERDFRKKRVKHARRIAIEGKCPQDGTRK
jgi:hypothetical protein